MIVRKLKDRKGEERERKREPNTEEELSCYWIISGDTQNINILLKLGIFLCASRDFIYLLFFTGTKNFCIKRLYCVQ